MFPETVEFYGIAALTDGKVALAGSLSYPESGDNADLIAARLNGDGSSDATFGNEGLAIRPLGRGSSVCAPRAPRRQPACRWVKRHADDTTRGPRSRGAARDDSGRGARHSRTSTTYNSGRSRVGAAAAISLGVVRPQGRSASAPITGKRNAKRRSHCSFDVTPSRTWGRRRSFGPMSTECQLAPETGRNAVALPTP